MERRPELLSSVMLRQNPHNVHEWHKRAKIFQANPTKQILCYTGGCREGGAGCRRGARPGQPGGDQQAAPQTARNGQEGPLLALGPSCSRTRLHLCPVLHVPACVGFSRPPSRLLRTALPAARRPLPPPLAAPCAAEAVRTVDPDKATGKPHTLWVAFAKLYERHGDLPNARIIFEKAVQASVAHGGQPLGSSARCPSAGKGPHAARMPADLVPVSLPPSRVVANTAVRPAQARFKFVDDLATVWCEWAEMELRHKNFKRALEAMRRATQRPARPRTREVRRPPARDSGAARAAQPRGALRSMCVVMPAGPTRPQVTIHVLWFIPALACLPRCPPPLRLQEEAGLSVQDRLYRSLKLWSFYVDLEERCVCRRRDAGDRGFRECGMAERLGSDGHQGNNHARRGVLRWQGCIMPAARRPPLHMGHAVELMPVH